MASDPQLAGAVSFTAARRIGKGGQDVIAGVLAQLPPAARYVTGGAAGGDELIGRWLFEHRPGAEHVVVVPANRSQIAPWWEDFPGQVTVIEMPPGTTYAARNARLVLLGTEVQGFPPGPEDDPRCARSGTWQTIRMAARAGKLAAWHAVNPPYAFYIEKRPGRLVADRPLLLDFGEIR